MRYAGCVAISVTVVTPTQAPNALTPLLVARSRADPYAAATGAGANTFSPRHSAYRIRLRRRAKATTAMRLPRRAATRSTHARSVPLAVLRQHAQAAWTKRLR